MIVSALVFTHHFSFHYLCVPGLELRRVTAEDEVSLMVVACKMIRAGP